MATMSFDYRKTNSGVVIERYRGTESVVDVPYRIADSTVIKIDNATFAGCNEIKRINIPFCVNEIAIDAFAGCTRLKEIFWDNTLIKLGGDSVKRCGRNEIQVPKFFAVPENFSDTSKLLKTPVEDFDYSYIEEGILIEKYLGSDSIVVVPQKIEGVPVVSIGFDALGGCMNLKELRLPAGLISIHSRALDGCRNLQAVYVSKNLRGDKVADEILAALPEGCAIHYT